MFFTMNSVDSTLQSDKSEHEDISEYDETEVEEELQMDIDAAKSKTTPLLIEQPAAATKDSTGSVTNTATTTITNSTSTTQSNEQARPPESKPETQPTDSNTPLSAMVKISQSVQSEFPTTYNDQTPSFVMSDEAREQYEKKINLLHAQVASLSTDNVSIQLYV